MIDLKVFFSLEKETKERVYPNNQYKGKRNSWDRLINNRDISL